MISDKSSIDEGIVEQINRGRKKFRVDHFDILVSEYVARFNNGKIILDPPYQRTFRWDIVNQSQLIESVLLGLPLPPIFVFSNQNALWEVIDGVQRTTTFCNFLNDKVNKHIFEGCEILTELNGKSYSDLPEFVKNSLGNVRLRIEIIEDTADIQSQYLLFSRLNSNGINLSPQELRNFLIYKINPDFYNKINDLKNNELFKSAIDFKSSRKEKQEDLEYVIRFFLSRKFALDKPSPNSYNKIDNLITAEIKEFLENNTPVSLEKEYGIFVETFAFINNLLGPNSFRYFIPKINSIVNTYSIAPALSFFLDEYKNHEKTKSVIKSFYDSEKYQQITKQSYSPTKRMFDLSKYAYEFFSENKE